MKTAISVEDSLMEEADAVARDLGMSRSGLVSEALRTFLRQRRSSQLTEQFNQAYAAVAAPAERRRVRRIRAKMPIQDKW